MSSNSDDHTQIRPPIPENPAVPIRDELVNTAVKFLTNPSVQKSAVSNREAFLRNKGLTEQEISAAFQRSQAFIPPQQFHGSPPQQQTSISMPYPQGYLLPPQSGWSKFKELINTVAIIGGFVYGLYLLYKRYIAPFLFGPSKKRSAIEESIASLDSSVKQSVDEIRADLQKVQSDVEKINEQQISPDKIATSKQVLDVKNEVTSLKGLLLNRKQFPSTVETPSTSAHSIPAWQMSDDDIDPEKVRSSSHSSSTEATTTNGSDSSVELIGD